MTVTQKRYEVGEKVYHEDYGEGMVVEVRPRTFFDILEVAFKDGVRRLNSNHPKISDGPRESASPPGDRGPARAAKRARPPKKTRRTSDAARRNGDEMEAEADREEPSTTPTPVPTVAPELDGDDEVDGADGDTGTGVDPGSEAESDDFPVRFRAGDMLRLDRSTVAPFLVADGVESAAPSRGKTAAETDRVMQRLQAEKIALTRGFKNLLALSAVRDLERYDHQMEAALRVLRRLHGRAILADEVGLGKTIEAGLVLKEYVLRGLVRRALVLTPVSLMSQWREELRHKFDLPFEIRSRGMEWDAHPFLIASIDTAKTERNRNEIARAGYDILVVDEAHRLRNHLTQGWKFVDALSLKYLLLLTATPVQNDLRELYNLVTLLKPGLLGTYREFRHRYMTRGDKRLPKDPSGLAAMLGEVMIRTSRASTSLRFPKREVRVQEFHMTPAERELYDSLSEFVRDLIEEADPKELSRWHFLLVLLQKELGSCAHTALRTLERTEHLFVETDRRERFAELTELARNIQTHSKVEGLKQLLAEHKGEKVLVFTQFRRTLEFLADALHADGHDPALFHGSLGLHQKDAAVEAFRGPKPILVSTEAGGEGRNLQFCHIVVNFDLPWNPMRIEQRIGRVHRLGQTHDTVIYNFTTRDTVEDYVLAILHRKIQMFELVVGEMDMVLGQWSDRDSFEQEIFKIWTAKRSAKEREKAFDDLAEDLLLARRRHERVQEYDELVFSRLDLPAGALRTETP